jgi:hypothetical protein
MVEAAVREVLVRAELGALSAFLAPPSYGAT